ncbi:pectate lyase family protein [Thermophagus sp. OGC60D27]|uniref:pectate lyase family protein n=1 Tax=Thermophagus sp. OGC60D27 TaxID=3458415 RepID=UPI004037DFEC
MKKLFLITFVSLLGILFYSCSVSEDNDEILPAPAFPGALGAGKATTGGRGGEVVLVTNLNNSGAGSLREAVRMKGPRIVVFKVSGNIDLKSSIDIENGDITIAGHTAPGEGICLRRYPMRIRADNVIVRYLRFRPGDVEEEEMDAFTCLNNRNVIIDHCSFSWGSDEVCSIYDNENVTLQWCIISESLNHSIHHKGDHGFGGIWGGKTASFIGNLLAHHTSRNPRLQGSRYHNQPDKERAEFVNNVVYNWQSKTIYGGEAGYYNIVNNYFKPGPATEEGANGEILEPYKPYGKFFLYGNVFHNNELITTENSQGIDADGSVIESILSDVPYQISDYEPLSASGAYSQVLNHAGASLERDEVDRRIIEDVENGSASYGDKGIIDSQDEVGGWPTLDRNAVPDDQDSDGIPDEWEEAHGLDKTNPSDASRYSVSVYYTNIEVWMNELLED